MRDYPTLQEVIEIQKQLIDMFGGAHGIREKGALEAALMRPQLGYYQNIMEEASALMESLGTNHPFLDGNKRVAFFVTDTFLRMNGLSINCDNDEAYDYIMNLFDKGQFQFDQLYKWLSSTVYELS